MCAHVPSWCNFRNHAHVVNTQNCFAALTSEVQLQVPRLQQRCVSAGEDGAMVKEGCLLALANIVQFCSGVRNHCVCVRR